MRSVTESKTLPSDALTASTVIAAPSARSLAWPCWNSTDWNSGGVGTWRDPSVKSPPAWPITKWTVAFLRLWFFDADADDDATLSPPPVLLLPAPATTPPPSLFSASKTHSPDPSVAHVLCHEWWWPWKVASTPAFRNRGSSCSLRSRLTATSEALSGASVAAGGATFPLGAALPLKLLSM